MAADVAADVRAWLERVVMGLNLCPFARAALPGTHVVVSKARTLEDLRAELAAELDALRVADVAAPATTLLVLPPASVAALDAATFEGFMEGCVAAAERETRRVTASVTEAERRALGLDLEDGDLVDVVPFHPRATFGPSDDDDDDDDDAGVICTYLDVPEDAAADVAADVERRQPFDRREHEASLKRLIDAHADFRGGADTRADWADAAAQSGGDAEDPADFTGRSPHPVLHLLRRTDIDAAERRWVEKNGGDIRAANAATLRGMGAEELRGMLRACVDAGRPRDDL